MRLLTGVPEVDELAARTATPAPQEAASVVDISSDASVARISAKTRRLEALGDRPGLRCIVAARFGEEELHHLARVRGLDTLQLTDPKCRSLGPLASCTRLEVLTLSASSKLVSLEGIGGLPALRLLSAWHTPALGSIEAIASLDQLQVLHLAGAMYRSMRLPSLAPLASLRSLRVLTLSGVSVRDRSLRPLGGLTRLLRLELPLLFPATEFEWLEGALPDVKGQWRTMWRARASRR